MCVCVCDMNGEEEKKDEQQRQQTILLTGFSGWGLISTNPSQLIAERVGNLVPRLANGRVQLVTATLPVQWEAATEMLRALIAQLRPIAVLCLGLSQGISSLHVERVAVNLWYVCAHGTHTQRILCRNSVTSLAACECVRLFFFPTRLLRNSRKREFRPRRKQSCERH